MHAVWLRFSACPRAGSRLARAVFAPAIGVAQHKDWPLVWSVQPLLEPQCVVTQTLRQQLGMRSPPPLSAVLQHLQMVSQVVLLVVLSCLGVSIPCSTGLSLFVLGVLMIQVQNRSAMLLLPALPALMLNVAPPPASCRSVRMAGRTCWPPGLTVWSPSTV